MISPQVCDLKTHFNGNFYFFKGFHGCYLAEIYSIPPPENSPIVYESFELPQIPQSPPMSSTFINLTNSTMNSTDVETDISDIIHTKVVFS